MRAFAADQRSSPDVRRRRAVGMDPCELRQNEGDAAVRALVDRPGAAVRVRHPRRRSREFDLDTEEGRLAGLGRRGPHRRGDQGPRAAVPLRGQPGPLARLPRRAVRRRPGVAGQPQRRAGRAGGRRREPDAAPADPGGRRRPRGHHGAVRAGVRAAGARPRRRPGRRAGRRRVHRPRAPGGARGDHGRGRGDRRGPGPSWSPRCASVGPQRGRAAGDPAGGDGPAGGGAGAAALRASGWWPGRRGRGQPGRHGRQAPAQPAGPRADAEAYAAGVRRADRRREAPADVRERARGAPDEAATGAAARRPCSGRGPGPGGAGAGRGPSRAGGPSPPPTPCTW